MFLYYCSFYSRVVFPLHFAIEKNIFKAYSHLINQTCKFLQTTIMKFLLLISLTLVSCCSSAVLTESARTTPSKDTKALIGRLLENLVKQHDLMLRLIEGAGSNPELTKLANHLSRNPIFNGRIQRTINAVIKAIHLESKLINKVTSKKLEHLLRFS